MEYFQANKNRKQKYETNKNLTFCGKFQLNSLFIFSSMHEFVPTLKKRVAVIDLVTYIFILNGS